MKFGICTSLDTAPAVKAAGWDYVEANVQSVLQGTVVDDVWTGGDRAKQCPLPILTANMLVPASLKITGPDARLEDLRRYLETVCRRAAHVGIRTLVFGSGGARQVPDGFNGGAAHAQLVAFGAACGEIAEKHGVTIVAEHLNRKECNILNSLDETLGLVKEIDHPNFLLLVDTYHFWLEEEPLEDLVTAMPFIRHVHVADREGRVPPGESGGKSHYRPLFSILKWGGYDGVVSVEGDFPEPKIRADGPRILNFLRDEWAAS